MFKHIAILAAAALSIPASATVINFDSLANGAVVTNQFAPATFSSIAGSQVLITSQSLGSSTPNFICSGRGGSINCTDPVFVAFASAVTNLSFTAVGDNVSGINGVVSVYNGATLLGTTNIFGDNVFLTPYNVNLASYGAITRIEITTTDPAGLGYDDFTFDVSNNGGVPEPATWAMMLAGFGVVGAAMRRRRVTVSFA
ncbi:MAG: PEPxxWA-CTERM sorting domain-containing protein [Sphingomonadales bacterium]